MVAAPASSDTRQMSWAERAKASVSKPTPPTKSTSPTPSNTSNATSNALDQLSDSTSSVPSGLTNGHTTVSHGRSGSDFATTAVAPPLPVEEAPSGAAEEIIVPSPHRAAPVNVWKERMAAAAAQKPSAPAPIATAVEHVSLPVEQRSPVQSNGKSPSRGRSIAPAQLTPPALADTTNWPSPLDVEKGKAIEEAAVKARAADTSPSATSSRSSGGQETSKAKKKWIPIEADITIDAPLPTRYLKDGERSRASTRSHSRETPRSVNATRAESVHRPESQPLSAGVPAFPIPAAHLGGFPPIVAPLPTSLPAKPVGLPAAIAPDGSMSMRAGSPRVNGTSPVEGLRSPTSPTTPLSRSMSGSSMDRASSVAGSSSGRIESLPASRIDYGPFGGQQSPRGGSFGQNTRGRGSGVPRGASSPRGAQGQFGRGGRGGFNRGRGAQYSNGMPGHPQMGYYENPYTAPYGNYMPQMAYRPQAAPWNGQQASGQPQMLPGQPPFNMMPMMQNLPPAPFKTDYQPPLDKLHFYLLGQVEFYLSPDNLAKDLFLRQQMDQEGWIDMRTVLSFKRISALTSDLNVLRETIALSPLIDVDNVRYKFRAKQDWAKWIMPGAKPAEPAIRSNGTHTEPEDHEDGSKSAEQSASEDGDTTGTTGLTSPASQPDDLPEKAEAAVAA